MTNFLHHPGGDADNLPENWINPPVFVSSPLITEEHLYSPRHYNSLTSIVSSSASSTSVTAHLSCDTSKLTAEDSNSLQTPPQIIQNLLYNIIEDYEKTEEPSSQTCSKNNDESHLSYEELDRDVTLSNCETIAGDYLNSIHSSCSSLSTNLDEDKAEFETEYKHTSTSYNEKVNILQENEDDYKNIYLKYYDSDSNASSSFSLVGEELLPTDYDQKETIPIHSSKLNLNKSLPMLIKISYSDLCLNEKVLSIVDSDRENSADFASHVEESVASFSETSSITTSCKDDSSQELEPSTSDDQTHCTNYDNLEVDSFENHDDSLDVLSSFIPYQPTEDVSFVARDFQDASISKFDTQTIIKSVLVNEDSVNVDIIPNKEYIDTQHINEGLLDINQTNELFACNVNSSENLVAIDQTPMEPYLSEFPQLNDPSSSLNCRKEEDILPTLSSSCKEPILIDKSTNREICPSSPQFHEQLALKDIPKLNEYFLDQVPSILPMHQQTFNNVSLVNLNIDKELPLKDTSKDYPKTNHEYDIKACSMLLPLDTLLPTCNLGKDEDDVQFVRVLQSEDQSFNSNEPFSTCLEESNIGLPIHISKNKEKINYPEYYQDYPSNDNDTSSLSDSTQPYFDPIRDEQIPQMNVLIPEQIKELHLPRYPDKELLPTATKINEKNHLDKICRSDLNFNGMKLNKYIKRPNGDSNIERVIKTGLERKAFHQISFLRWMLDTSFQLLKELFFSAAFPSNPYY